MPVGTPREEDARFDALKKNHKALMERINARRQARGQEPLAAVQAKKQAKERAIEGGRELTVRAVREAKRGGTDTLTRDAEDRNTAEIARLQAELRALNRERIQGKAVDDMVEVLAPQRSRFNDVAGLKTIEDRAYHREFLNRVGTSQYASYKKAFVNYALGGVAFAGPAADAQTAYKAMSVEKGRFRGAVHTESNVAGGFLVPEEIEWTIDRILYKTSPMRQLATVRPMTSATLKRFFNMGGSTVGWTGERDTRAETNTPTVKELEYPAAEVYALPKMSQVAIEDAGLDLESWLAEELQIAFSEAENDAFINGNGDKKPWGLIGGYSTVANATFAADVSGNFGKWGYIATGAASDFPTASPADVLVNLHHAVRPAYRGAASWIMNDLTAAKVSKFKDGEGNYLWRNSISDDHGGQLIGKPVFIDENWPDIGADAYPIAFGDFGKAYLILDRAGIRTLRDDLTSKGWVIFYTRKRVMGGGYNFEALKLLKCATS